jgi:hypothetical protein
MRMNIKFVWPMLLLVLSGIAQAGMDAKLVTLVAPVKGEK